jgi:hypothetical protein
MSSSSTPATSTESTQRRQLATDLHALEEDDISSSGYMGAVDFSVIAARAASVSSSVGIATQMAVWRMDEERRARSRIMHLMRHLLSHLSSAELANEAQVQVFTSISAVCLTNGMLNLDMNSLRQAALIAFKADRTVHTIALALLALDEYIDRLVAGTTPHAELQNVVLKALPPQQLKQ